MGRRILPLFVAGILGACCERPIEHLADFIPDDVDREIKHPAELEMRTAQSVRSDNPVVTIPDGSIASSQTGRSRNTDSLADEFIAGLAEDFIVGLDDNGPHAPGTDLPVDIEKGAKCEIVLRVRLLAEHGGSKYHWQTAVVAEAGRCHPKIAGHLGRLG